MILHSKICEEGQPFIILHGLLGMGDNWGTLGRKWAKEGFQVHLVDLRNHGRSPQSIQMNYELISEDLLEYIDHHKLSHPIALGHSLGGKALMHFATSHPTILKQLIIADIAPRPYPREHQRIFEAIKKVDFEKVSNKKQLDGFLSEFIKDAATRALLLKNTYQNTEGKLGFLFYLEGIEKNYPSLIEDEMGEGICYLPALFLRGEDSPYIADEDLEIIYRHFPQAKVLHIKGANHWLHVDNPQEVYERVMEFIR